MNAFMAANNMSPEPLKTHEVNAGTAETGAHCLVAGGYCEGSPCHSELTIEWASAYCAAAVVQASV